MIFTRIASTKRTSSALAMALALASGSMLAATALEAPAQAQKMKKSEKKEEASAKGEYSKEFIAVYKPLADQLQAEADPASLKAGVPGVLSVASSADERMAAGQLAYSIGQKASDLSLQLQGIGLMIDSGKVPAENVGAYNFQAGQTAYQLKDFAKSRDYLKAAIDAGYNEHDPEALIAETYFAEKSYQEGITYLTGAIEARKAAGQPVSEDWVKRGLAMAYNNQLTDQANKYALMYVTDYPSDVAWKDAVAIALNTGKYPQAATLDLFRLARRVNGLQTKNVYLEYIDAADPRKLPQEVASVIDEGYANGTLDKADAYVADARKVAASRITEDKQDLPALAKAARASNAKLVTVMAAGDAYLSYGKAAEAEEFYTKALGMAGADKALVMTRLGIAQLDQGKRAEAEASFDKVDGQRQAIANLWKAYAAQPAA